MASMKKWIFCALCIGIFLGSLFLEVDFQNSPLKGNTSTNSLENQQLFEFEGPISAPASQFQKNFTFSGQNQVETSLSFQGIGSLASDVSQEMTILTHKWNISEILVNFTDIHTETVKHGENVTPPSGFLPVYNSSVGTQVSYLAMEFKMALPAFIFNLKLYLQYAGNFTVNTQIYGAVSSGTGVEAMPKPLGTGCMAVSENKNLVTYGSEIKIEWIEFKFNPRTLKDFINPLNSYQNSFFVILFATPILGNTPIDGSGVSFLRWGRNTDNLLNPDNGAVYASLTETAWSQISGIDLLLENISYSPLTWQGTFGVESSAPTGNNNFELIYDERILGPPKEQINAQQFQTNVNSYLSNFSTYLQYFGELTVWAEVYNATKSSSSNPGKAIPHKLLLKSGDITISSKTKEAKEWRTFQFFTEQTLNSSFLNVQNTYNKSFFVVLGAIGTSLLLQDYVNWGFIADSSNGDQGLAYFWNQSQRLEFWSLYATPKDLCLKDISLLSYEYNPLDVSLKVNETGVDNYSGYKFGGFVFLNGPFVESLGKIFLETTADFEIYYQVSWVCKYYNRTKALASFKGYSLSNSIQWNVTLTTNYPTWNSSSQGVGKYVLRRINITLPTDHSVNRIFYNTFLYPFWNTTHVGDKQFILIVGLSGNWRLQIFSPNYVEEVHAYNGTKELTQFYVKDNLNTTAKLKCLTSTTAVNLTVFNVSSKIVHTQTVIASSYWAKYALWVLSENDTHYLVVSWYNGTEVGIRSLEIMCVYHTKLTKNFPNPNLDLGLITGTAPIKIGVFYNDTDNNRGIPFAKNGITVNITPYAVVEYDSLLYPGYYNLTIYTSLLTNGNWSAKIQASRRGYNTSTLLIRFELFIGANATLNVTDGCRWQAEGWWVNPDPFFDDQTHKITVLYANGTYPYEGIEYSQVVAIPNWAATSWYGVPTNASPGFYDIAIDTEGLHEGQIGRIDIIAYSPSFETKRISVSLSITEIPANLLFIDAGPYENITCYEGESLDIAMGYWDAFHERPILFENATMGNLTWQIVGTGANGTLVRSVWQYEATISLPAWGILGTNAYNIEITALALRDYAIYQMNLTLNVKSKENTTLHLTTWTPTEYRVGHSFYIYANLTYENSTPLVNTKVDFNITLWNQEVLQEIILDSRFTSLIGTATYYYSEIPDGIDQIRIQTTYDGTPKIDPANDLNVTSILPKFNVSISILSSLPTEIMVGNTLQLEALLFNEETLVGVANETIEFVLIFDLNVNITRAATTNSQGHAFIEIQIPEDKSGYNSFQVMALYAGSADSESALYTAQTTIAVMTLVKYLINILPYIGIAIAVVLGVYLSYRQFIAVPRRHRRVARMEKIALKYSDLINLQHILVIHSTSGSCIYQHSFGEVNFDADLISGFLTALSAFESELKVSTPAKLPVGEKQLHGEAESSGFELNYANFKVLLTAGHITRMAFILAASPSISLRLSANEFVRKFEENYRGELINWKGAIAPFKTADKIIAQTFETTLLWPHIMESISEDRMKTFNSLESSLVTLALTIQKEKQYFFLPALIPMVEKVRRASNPEILGTIDDLRRKGIFKAISIEELEQKLQQTANNNTEPKH